MSHLEMLEKAQVLDAKDPLGPYRNEFLVADPRLIYVDGNSLGRMPRGAQSRVEKALSSEWGRRLVRAWNEGWYEMSLNIGAKIAGLIGAGPDEVIVADSTTINLHKLVTAALKLRTSRDTILTDASNFPSDLYVIQSCAKTANGHVRVVPSGPDGIAEPDRIESAMNECTALVALTQVAFKSGALHDMKRSTASAHKAGALALWDLSHSVGAMPIDLNGCGVDLAVGCTYKYLNGGPGAPAFVFVSRKLQAQLENPIVGWFGHEEPFAFSQDHYPAKGIRKFLTGTPPILSLCAIEAGVDLCRQAGLGSIREKSIALTEFFISLCEQFLARQGFTLQTPRNPLRRGSHVSLSHPEAHLIDRALIEKMKVVPDFRVPNNIRYGFSPLYTTFTEVYEAARRTEQVVSEKLHTKLKGEAPSVT